MFDGGGEVEDGGHERRAAGGVGGGAGGDVVAAVFQDRRRRRPPAGAAGVAGGRQPVPGDPPAAALHVRGARPPREVRAHLHHADGAAHAHRRHRRRPHPRRARQAGRGVRQPPRGQPDAAALQRRQVHRQLGAVRPALARAPPQLRRRDRVAAAGEGILVDPRVGRREPPPAAPRRVRRHRRRQDDGQLPPLHLQHPHLHLLRRQDPRRAHPRDRGGAQGRDDDDHAQAPGLPPAPHAALHQAARRGARTPAAPARLPGPAGARAPGVHQGRRREERRREHGGRRRGDGERARRGVRGLAVRPGAAGAGEEARRGRAGDALLRGDERRHGHQRHRAGVGHDAPRPRRRRPGQALRRGRLQGRHHRAHHRGRRRGYALLAGNIYLFINQPNYYYFYSSGLITT